jgi:hypothetical protein
MVTGVLRRAVVELADAQVLLGWSHGCGLWVGHSEGGNVGGHVNAVRAQEGA